MFVVFYYCAYLKLQMLYCTTIYSKLLQGIFLAFANHDFDVASHQTG